MTSWPGSAVAYPGKAVIFRSEVGASELPDGVDHELDRDRGQQQPGDASDQVDAGLAQDPLEQAGEPQGQVQHGQHAQQPEGDPEALVALLGLAHEHHDGRDRAGPGQQRRAERDEGDVGPGHPRHALGLAPQQVQRDHHQQQPPGDLQARHGDPQVDEDLLAEQGEGGDDEGGHRDRLPGGPVALAGAPLGRDSEEDRDGPHRIGDHQQGNEALGQKERVDHWVLRPWTGLASASSPAAPSGQPSERVLPMTARTLARSLVLGGCGGAAARSTNPSAGSQQPPVCAVVGRRLVPVVPARPACRRSTRRPAYCSTSGTPRPGRVGQPHNPRPALSPGLRNRFTVQGTSRGAPVTREKWLDPSNWASLKPFGIGEEHPNNYLELWKAFKENRDQARYAWRILSQGTCDGCALGTKGMRDWTTRQVHLCNVRLRLLRLNTMPALDTALLADVALLAGKRSAELRGLGRLPYPMVRRRGEPGFTRIGWDEALDLVAGRVRASTPGRLGVYLTSRGTPNETYFAAQKAVRAMGTNSVDNAARVCHSPSTFGLKGSLGVAATTCSYSDWIGSDLIVFVGANVANNQPVAMKYLYHAKKAGTKIAVVNPYREPGMERYWVPSNVESALFGTTIADHYFLINVGGDIGFLNGALKQMIEQGLVDRGFIDNHTEGFDQLAQAVNGQSWEELEALAGAPRQQMEEFAAMLGKARTAVLVGAWVSPSTSTARTTSGRSSTSA